MDLWWRLLDYARAGGWIMIPLGLASCAMWMLIVERLMAFRRFSGGDLRIQDAVRAIRGETVNTFGHGVRATLVREYMRIRTGDPELDRHMLRQCALKMRPGINRFLPIIAVLGSIAPLLGLLGTVIGMIATFEVISTYGTGNAKAMANGISIALVTTEAGLLVAIPGLLLSAGLARRASKLLRNLDEITLVLEHQIR
ncbi:MAG TPA: MotA/TolQ/ExbB proton channel family protein [Candidatus Krumholzibacteria bacterium]|nr:MotA/TolQ/ExbB proton channel family protein [Candidatus Krumholzibacteria bacterium]